MSNFTLFIVHDFAHVIIAELVGQFLIGSSTVNTVDAIVDANTGGNIGTTITLSIVNVAHNLIP
jgi:hypothetical protein